MLRGVPPRRRDQLPPGGPRDHVVGADVVLLARVGAARRAAEDSRGAAIGASWCRRRNARFRRAAGDAVPARGDNGVDEAVPSGAGRHAVVQGGRRHAGRDVRGERMAGELQRLRYGKTAGYLGAGLRGVPAGAVAGGRGFPAGEPVQVPGVSRRAANVLGEGDGLHTDEVHRRFGARKVPIPSRPEGRLAGEHSFFYSQNEGGLAGSISKEGRPVKRT